MSAYEWDLEHISFLLRRIWNVLDHLCHHKFIWFCFVSVWRRWFIIKKNFFVFHGVYVSLKYIMFLNCLMHVLLSYIKIFIIWFNWLIKFHSSTHLLASDLFSYVLSILSPLITEKRLHVPAYPVRILGSFCWKFDFSL